jgi:hypothetical protein
MPGIPGRRYLHNGTALVSKGVPDLPLDGVVSQEAFPGDPGDGNYYTGWAAPSSIATGRSWTVAPDIGIYHEYAGSANLSASKFDVSINAGLIASQTFKGTLTPAQFASGAGDAAIDAMAAICAARAPHPLWCCYYHEPEDNITTAADMETFRAASRRIVLRFRAAGVTNVAWMPIYMNPYTFGPFSGRDWRTWHPDWTGSTWQDTLTMDLMGMDTYNPLPGSGTQRPSQGFDQMFDTARAKIELPGYPQWDYVIPEFGISNMANPTPDWVAWCTTARNYAKANRVKAFIYWDNSQVATGIAGTYSFGQPPAGATENTYDPSGQKKAGWDVIATAAKAFTPPA